MSDTNPQIILLEDSTLDEIPVLLKNLILENSKEELSSSQEFRLLILALTIYYITMEMGFVPTTLKISSKSSSTVEWGFNKQNIEKCIKETLPCDFKNQSHFKFNLNLINDDTNCILLMMRSGDSFFTTLTSKKFKGQSVYISAARYVPYVNKQKLSGSFRNLNELSNIVKDNLCGPIRNEILAEHNQVFPGLLGLPESHLDKIFKFLNNSDVKSVALTCKYLHREAKDFKKRNKKN